MTTELTVTIDASPESLTPNVRHQIESAVRAIAVSLGVCGLTADFDARRTELIAVANVFERPPHDDSEQEKMLRAQRDLAAFRITVTKEEAAFKAPLNAAKSKIIEITESGLAPVETAEKRLQSFINHRQQKLAETRRAAEANAERERQRVANEAAAAHRAQEEAERARAAAAVAAQQAETLKGQQKAEADAEAARLAAEASRLEDESLEAGLAAEAAPEAVAAPVSDLPMAKEIFDFEIIGRSPSEKMDSLIKLLNAHKNFFGSHIAEEKPRSFSLTLKISDLMDALAGKPPFKKLESAPGIHITKRLSQLR